MSDKLDEIERVLLSRPEFWGEEYGLLLIRAVRQLGADSKTFEGAFRDALMDELDTPEEIEARVAGMRSADPDVLELIAPDQESISVVANDGAE